MSAQRAPTLLCNHYVVVHAVVDNEVVFTDRNHVYVAGVRLGRVPRLAIGESFEPPHEHLLFYCDETWNVLAVGFSGSLEHVMHGADKNYQGVAKRWVPTLALREDVRASYELLRLAATCRFCGAKPDEIESSLESEAHGTICDRCVARALAAPRANVGPDGAHVQCSYCARSSDVRDFDPASLRLCQACADTMQGD